MRHPFYSCTCLTSLLYFNVRNGREIAHIPRDVYNIFHLKSTTPTPLKQPLETAKNEKSRVDSGAIHGVFMSQSPPKSSSGILSSSASGLTATGPTSSSWQSSQFSFCASSSGFISKSCHDRFVMARSVFTSSLSARSTRNVCPHRTHR